MTSGRRSNTIPQTTLSKGRVVPSRSLTMNLVELIKKYKDLSNEAFLIKKKILSQIRGWEAIANLGFLVDAVTAYKKEHNCSLKEAIEVIRQYNKNKKL